jgi:hypothetical protein
MESLNHDMDDMDELFRRAAGGYPLKAGDGDWDKVSGKLLSKAEIIASAKKSMRRRYFGLLFLLFVIAGASSIYYAFEQGSNKQADLRSSDRRELKNENRFRRDTGNKVVDKHSDKLAGSDEEEVKGENKMTAREESAVQKTNKDQAITHNIPPAIAAGNKEQIPKAEDQSEFSSIKLNTERKGRITESINEATKAPEKVGGDKLPRQVNISNSRLINQKVISLPRRALFLRRIAVPYSIPLDDAVFSMQRSKMEGAIMSSADTFIIDRRIDEFAKQTNRGPYLGLTGGPDFSIVKSQAVSKIGYNIGLVFGYRFNEKWSVESGLLWSRKKYYSDGKYFSMSKVGPMMPSSMKILAVDGQFTLLELPLKAKYDFALKKKSNLFVSTGILSNVYLKELNNYLTDMNGIQEYHVGLYKENFYSWGCLVNVSAGYEYGIGKSRTIRLEPFIEIPIKKVGMGNMSVLSTGINVAILNLFSKKIP